MIELAFAVFLAILFYTYIGYPIVISVLASYRPKAIHRGPYAPRVAVIIVVYNEHERIEEKLETCLSLDYPRDKIRILVVSDGSDDGTEERVAAYGAFGVDLLTFPNRRGKAACLNDAIASCREEIIVLTDVRQRLDTIAVSSLVRNFADPSIGGASGELVFETEGTTKFAESIDTYWRYEKLIRRQESRFYSVVGVTGALYALRRECFHEIPANTILDDVVIPLNIVLGGHRVVHDGFARVYDSPSLDYRQEKTRKVRTAAGNYQLLFSHPAFLVPIQNPVFFQYVSHKVLRLMSPFCLALLLIANFLLVFHSTIYQILLVGHLMVYAITIAGSFWPSVGNLRLVGVAKAFLLLNWFALLGLVEFSRNRNVHLWRKTGKSTP